MHVVFCHEDEIEETGVYAKVYPFGVHSPEFCIIVRKSKVIDLTGSALLSPDGAHNIAKALMRAAEIVENISDG